MRAEIAKVVPATLGSWASGTNLFSLRALFILACVRGARVGARRPLSPRLSARRQYFSHSLSLPLSSFLCLPLDSQFEYDRQVDTAPQQTAKGTALQCTAKKRRVKATAKAIAIDEEAKLAIRRVTKSKE